MSKNVKSLSTWLILGVRTKYTKTKPTDELHLIYVKKTPRTVNTHYLKFRTPVIVITPAIKMSNYLFIYSLLRVVIEGVEKNTFALT